MPKSLLFLLILCATLLGQSRLCHALVAGHVQFVTGDVKIINHQNLPRQANKGGEVHEGETLLSAAGASAQLLMIDKGLIALRPDSQLTIEHFRFDAQESTNDNSALSLARGAFRAITGLIGRINKNAYVIKTPNAIIGIRGTDHETAYVAPPAPGTDSPIPHGTYNRVNVGSTFIQTEQGRLELLANQIGFAQLNNAPVRLERTPAIFQTSGTATPHKTAGGKKENAGETDTGRSTRFTSPITTSAVTRLTSTAGSCLTCNTAAPIPADSGNLSVTQAPANTGLVGGARNIDTSGITTLDSGAIDNLRGDILRDSNKLPSRITDNTTNNQFVYERNGAADVPGSAGSTTIGSDSNSTWVNWGIYTGGQKADTDSSGSFKPVTHFAWMVAEGGITPTAWLQNNLSTFATGITFNVVGGFTQPIDETGAIGGKVSALSATIAVNGGIPSLTQYNLNVVDAQNRFWAASLTAPSTLSTFMDSSNSTGENNTNLSVSRYINGFSGTVAATGSGKTSGFVIGPQSPSGIISSYNLKDNSNAAVMGTVLVK